MPPLRPLALLVGLRSSVCQFFFSTLWLVTKTRSEVQGLVVDEPPGEVSACDQTHLVNLKIGKTGCSRRRSRWSAKVEQHASRMSVDAGQTGRSILVR
jgi:hypothetical protein